MHNDLLLAVCRLFGTTAYCSYCEQAIASCDMVMRAKENVYHLECFACFKCQHRSENIGLPNLS